MTEQGTPALQHVSPQRTVAVIGLGYVGLPLAVLWGKNDFNVYGIDIDTRKIDALMENKSYLPDLSDEELRKVMQSGRLHPVTDMAKIKEAEAIIICVPTPLTAYHTPDLSYLQDAAKQIGEHLRAGQIVILESSTYPGTTKEVLQPILEKESGLTAGEDFNIGYSPERIDPGNKQYSPERIPKLVSGLTERCCDRLESLYSLVFERVIRVSSPEVAEMAKIMENSQRLVNITFMNEMAMICDQMGVDVWEVIAAASTKPFGFTPYYPGPGIGGHCIPVDPLYLQWKSKAYGDDSKFISLSESMNRSMPHYVADHVFALLGERRRAEAARTPAVSGKVEVTEQQHQTQASTDVKQPPASQTQPSQPKILLYGVAYKKDINDVRESPALDLIDILRRKGALVSYHDPYIDKIKVGSGASAIELNSVELTADRLREVDCVIIVTDHTGIPVETIVKHAPLVFDTRNTTAAFKEEAHVYRLGGGKSAL